MFGIEKDFQNLMEQVYGPLNKDKMTEIEELKGQIKVLEKKVALLEQIEKHKSPVEKAYKDAYGDYPVTDDMSGGDMDYVSWDAFQKGYNAAYEEKVAQEPEEEPEELKTLYQMFYEKKWNKLSCDEFCDVVKEWMFQYTHSVMTGDYLEGYEECLTVLEENLK